MILVREGVNFSATPADFFAAFAATRPCGPDCQRGDMFYAAPDDLVAQRIKRKFISKFGKTN
eukprot:11062028-Alexandrium_andersonii.AAC.1